VNGEKPFGMVVWEDAHGNATDEYSEGDNFKHRPAIYHTYGWIYQSDDAGVTLFMEHCIADRSWRGRAFVPRKMVVEEVILNLVKPRKKREPKVVDKP